MLGDAIDANDVVELKRLLAAGEDPNSKNAEGAPQLLAAVDEESLEMVVALLEGGALVDSTDGHHTALTAAIGVGALDIVRELIKRGADLNHNNGQTPLTAACYDEYDEVCRTDIVRALVAAGADVNIASEDGWTPMMLIAQHGDKQLVEELLAAGAIAATQKVSAHGVTDALEIARHHGSEDIAVLLEAATAVSPEQTAATITTLFHAFCEELAKLGIASHQYGDARIPLADDSTLSNIKDELGEVPDAISHWWKIADRELPLMGGYSTISAANSLERALATQELNAKGTFEPHLKNIQSRKDGRWDDERMDETYWSYAWIAVARDGCGNEICVDTDPGVRGAVGQLINMEFQDGQGPYMSPFKNFEQLLRTHLAALKAGHFSVDESGYFEFEDLTPRKLRALIASSS